MTPRVSVIVAAYNAEQWLPRCLDSLLCQTLEDIEVILIDDGSTDSTGRIADEYSSRDSRIQVIHQSNCGVSATRQTGIDHASGEFITFLDADDYAHPDAYRTSYDCAFGNHAAIVCSNYFRIDASGIRPVSNVKPRYSVSSKLRELFFHQNGYLWRHLISKDLISELGVRFPPRMSFGEDIFFLIDLLTRCKQKGRSIGIASCKAHLIYYDKTANPQSLTNLTAQKRFWSRFHWWETVHDQIKPDGAEATSFYDRLVDDCFAVLWNDSVPSNDLCLALKPYEASIRKHASVTPQKFLTQLLCQGKYEKARKLKYIGSFRIVRDKLSQALSTHR